MSDWNENDGGDLPTPRAVRRPLVCVPRLAESAGIPLLRSTTAPFVGFVEDRQRRAMREKAKRADVAECVDPPAAPDQDLVMHNFRMLTAAKRAALRPREPVNYEKELATAVGLARRGTRLQSPVTLPMAERA